jgi:hypothetical protein
MVSHVFDLEASDQMEVREMIIVTFRTILVIATVSGFVGLCLGIYLSTTGIQA